MDPFDVKTFCSRLPKVELHAHLNGSLSEETLYSLYMDNPDLKNDDSKKWMISAFSHGEIRSLEECFKIFDIAHAVTVTPAAVMKSTKDVISEFANDGVVYLELRTTPRSVPGVMSKKQYIQAVIDTIKRVPKFMSLEKFIIVKLLLSVNRRDSLAEAEENIREAIEAHTAYPDIVVGVDLSGNPKCGNVIDDLLPLFRKAQLSGLKVAMHCAEVPNEEEVDAILRFKPDRLGHGTCIHPVFGGSEKLYDLLLQSQIPVEVCLTSNLKCRTIENYESHHLQFFLNDKHPFAISTDDKGVFSTTLSEEFSVAAKAFALSSSDLYRYAFKSLEYSFASSAEIEIISEKFRAFCVAEGLNERND